MEKNLAILFLALMWTGANSQAIHCESQPPIRERVLNIQLGHYATLICEHKTRLNANNTAWYLVGKFTALMEQRHEDLIHMDWQNVPCLFSQNLSQNANCSRFFLIIAAPSNGFNNSETKVCTHLQTTSNQISTLCNARTFTVRIIEDALHADTVSATPSPTTSLDLMSTISLPTTLTNLPLTALTSSSFTTKTSAFSTLPTNLLYMTPTTDPLPTMTTPVTGPSLTSSSTGWMDQLNQWTNFLTLANIFNNVLQTILLSIVAILIVKALSRSSKKEKTIENRDHPLSDTGTSHIPTTFEMNDQGDEIDASFSTLFSNEHATNDSAIDMNTQTPKNTIYKRQSSRP